MLARFARMPYTENGATKVLRHLAQGIHQRPHFIGPVHINFPQIRLDGIENDQAGLGALDGIDQHGKLLQGKGMAGVGMILPPGHHMHQCTIGLRLIETWPDGHTERIFRGEEQRRCRIASRQCWSALLIWEWPATREIGGKLQRQERFADAGISIEHADGPERDIGPPEPGDVLRFNCARGGNQRLALAWKMGGALLDVSIPLPPPRWPRGLHEQQDATFIEYWLISPQKSQALFDTRLRQQMVPTIANHLGQLMKKSYVLPGLHQHIDQHAPLVYR